MISGQQRRAIRDFVIAALALDDRGAALDPLAPALPLVTATSVRWEGRDNARAPDGPRVTLAIVGAQERGQPEEVDRVEDDEDDEPQLVTYTRELLDVTVSIQVASRRSTTAPDFSQDADQILRRIWIRLHSLRFMAAFEAVGLAPTRRGAIVELPRLARAAQWETRAAFDAVFRATPMVAEVPGWIEQVTGTATYDPFAGAPFDTGTPPA